MMLNLLKKNKQFRMILKFDEEMGGWLAARQKGIWCLVSDVAEHE
jgi:hypothetical protein